MSTRPIQEPALVSSDPNRLGDRYEHPAFAAISAHRISGQFHLFGSNVGHSGAVAIELTEAALYRDDHHDRIHGGAKVIAKVYMSEAQWVAFISRMNMGSGTPCTLAYRCEGGLAAIPDLPDPEKPAERMQSRAQEMLDGSQRKQTEAAARLRALIADLKVTSKVKDALLSELGLVVDHGQVNRDYQRKVLAELNEELVKDAKIEIDAMVRGIVTQLGVSSIQQLAQLAADANSHEPKQLEE